MTTTNATSSGAVKTVIETAGLGVSVYRDVAPPKAHLPFCVVMEGIAWNTLPHGDTDAGDELAVREQLQVDIYQGFRGSDGTRTEDPDLEDQICYLLSQTRLPTWIHHTYGARIVARGRGESHDTNVKRTIVTLQIDRTFEARTGE